MICPKCGGEVPEDTIWVRFLKWYCSEECARPEPYASWRRP